MKHSLPRLFTALAILLTPFTSPAPAFMKLGDIKGESTEAGHEEEIDIHEVLWGVIRDRGSNAPTLNELKFSKPVDKSSPKLMEACANGQHIAQAVLTLRKPGRGSDYYKVTLEDVLISSYQTSGSSSDVVPHEELSLNYTKITFEFIPQDDTGAPTGPSVIGRWPAEPATIPGTGE